MRSVRTRAVRMGSWMQELEAHPTAVGSPHIARLELGVVKAYPRHQSKDGPGMREEGDRIKSDAPGLPGAVPARWVHPPGWVLPESPQRKREETAKEQHSSAAAASSFTSSLFLPSPPPTPPPSVLRVKSLSASPSIRNLPSAPREQLWLNHSQHWLGCRHCMKWIQM